MKLFFATLFLVFVSFSEIVSHMVIFSGHDIALLDSMLEGESEGEKQDSSEDENESQKELSEDKMRHSYYSIKDISLLHTCYVQKWSDPFLEVIIPPPDLV